MAKHIVFVLLVMFWVRYLPHPISALVADDWPNLARASRYNDAGVAARLGLTDPHRPLSYALVDALFHLFGDRPAVYTILSLAANAALVIFVMALARELTGSPLASAVAGLFLAVVPNLVETTHWSTQIVNEVSSAAIWYVASGSFYVRFYQSEKPFWLAASVACYGVALFSYEAGLFLPAAYAALCYRPYLSRPNILRLLPFAVVVAVYAAWRMTNAFGLNTSWHYPPHMQADISIGKAVWNAWQILHWWVGEHMLETICSGWAGFLQISVWTRRALLAGNVVLAVAVYRWLVKLSEEEPFTVPSYKPPRFAAWWFGASCVPMLMSYTASRLMLLPAVGLALGSGIAASRARSKSWMVLASLVVFLSAISLQGTTEQYRQVDEFNRRLFAHLRENRSKWENQLAVIFDTTGIRERQARRLMGLAGEHERTWAFYGNAPLFRGFVPRGMMELIVGSSQLYPMIVHDVENGLSRYGDHWIWHARYDPSRRYYAPTGSVFYVDLLKIAHGRGN